MQLKFCLAAALLCSSAVASPASLKFDPDAEVTEKAWIPIAKHVVNSGVLRHAIWVRGGAEAVAAVLMASKQANQLTTEELPENPKVQQLDAAQRQLDAEQKTMEKRLGLSLAAQSTRPVSSHAEVTDGAWNPISSHSLNSGVLRHAIWKQGGASAVAAVIMAAAASNKPHNSKDDIYHFDFQTEVNEEKRLESEETPAQKTRTRKARSFLLAHGAPSRSANPFLENEVVAKGWVLDSHPNANSAAHRNAVLIQGSAEAVAAVVMAATQAKVMTDVETLE